MKINKAYKYRIYPTKSQIEYIEGCFNACRYVYNVSLDCEQQLYQLGGKSSLSVFGLSYHLTNYKISEPWLNNYDSIYSYFYVTFKNSILSFYFNIFAKIFSEI